MPDGYREALNWGMIAYEVPLERYPNTYNKQPLSYAALAARKNHFALYLHCFEAGADRGQRLKTEFERAGKALDMGKSCVRFKRVDQLAFDAIGRIIAGTPVDELIALYEMSRKKG